MNANDCVFQGKPYFLACMFSLEAVSALLCHRETSLSASGGVQAPPEENSDI